MLAHYYDNLRSALAGRIEALTAELIKADALRHDLLRGQILGLDAARGLMRQAYDTLVLEETVDG